MCFVNEELCLPLKRGGVMLSINRFIECTCEGETVPEMVMADLSNLRAGERVLLDRVTFPEGVQPYRPRSDFTLGVIQGKNVKEAKEEEKKEEDEDI